MVGRPHVARGDGPRCRRAVVMARVGGRVGQPAKDLRVAPEQPDDQQGQQRQHHRLHGHERREHLDAAQRDHRHPASCRQVCWSTAAEQLQSRQSIRHGMMHVTSRHMMVPMFAMCVLHCP